LLLIAQVIISLMLHVDGAIVHDHIAQVMVFTVPVLIGPVLPSISEE
jgi:hypothetical protein